MKYTVEVNINFTVRTLCIRCTIVHVLQEQFHFKQERISFLTAVVATNTSCTHDYSSKGSSRHAVYTVHAVSIQLRGVGLSMLHYMGYI